MSTLPPRSLEEMPSIVEADPELHVVTTVERRKRVMPAASLNEFDAIVRQSAPDLYAIFENAETGRPYEADEMKALSEGMEATAFKAMQKEKAKLLDGFIMAKYKDVRVALMVLGWMLTMGERMGLYAYADDGYTNMKDWAIARGIDSAHRAHAIAVAEAWPYMQSLGLPLRELLDERYSKDKLIEIQRINRDATRQIKEKEKVILDHYLAQQQQQSRENERNLNLYTEDEDDEKGWSGGYEDADEGADADALPKATLPADMTRVREEAHRLALKEYRQNALVQIATIRNMSPADYIATTRMKGKRLGPFLLLHDLVEQRDGTWTGKVSIQGLEIACIKEDEWKAMEGGHYSLKLGLRGGDTLATPKEFATHILKRYEEELMDGVSLDDDDDDAASWGETIF
jgi:hypothetical protein